MTDCFTSNKSGIEIVCIASNNYESWLEQQSPLTQNWLKNSGFKPSNQKHVLIPSKNGDIEVVLLVTDNTDDIWNLAALPKQLPAGEYYCETVSDEQALAWGLGSYQFDRYISENSVSNKPKLFSDSESVKNQVSAIMLTRDLINTPAGDMMPQHLSDSAQQLAEEYQADFKEIVGDALLENNYPTIHAVGRASVHRPRLIDVTWGKAGDKKLTLVGKGVCFDSGGLDIKPANGMRWMKKDMGGAAHVLGLAKMIMAAKLPVQLRVLIPAVENAISENAFRPGDVITTRSGKTVEIDNTDAEGRLVLCDALSEAVNDKPALIIDFATLTGAARVAVGTEIAAFFSNQQTIAQQVMKAANTQQDPCWQLPLHQPYRDMLRSNIANLANSAETGIAGATTAALYLEEFVEDRDWLHFDIMAFNTRDRAGRPKGGEAMGLRASFTFIENWIKE